MALIFCYECGTRISDSAKSCPNCGARKKMDLNAVADSLRSLAKKSKAKLAHETKANEAAESSADVSPWGFILLILVPLVLFVVFLLTRDYESDNYDATADAAAAAAEASIAADEAAATGASGADAAARAADAAAAAADAADAAAAASSVTDGTQVGTTTEYNSPIKPIQVPYPYIGEPGAAAADAAAADAAAAETPNNYYSDAADAAAAAAEAAAEAANAAAEAAATE